MVASGSGCLRAMGRISSASFAAAARASRRTDGRGAGVGLLSTEGDGVALDALGPENDPEGELQFFEDRALFNVEFEVGAAFFVDGGVADAVDVEAALAKGVLEGLAVAVGPFAVGGDGVRSGEG